MAIEIVNGVKLRDRNEFCNNCRFWLPTDADQDGVPITGLCRKNPPALTRKGRTHFPLTQGDDWCGAWDGGKV